MIAKIYINSNFHWCFGIFRTISHNLLHYHVPDNDNIKVGSIFLQNTYLSKSISCIIILTRQKPEKKKSSDKIPSFFFQRQIFLDDAGSFFFFAIY